MKKSNYYLKYAIKFFILIALSFSIISFSLAKEKKCVVVCTGNYAYAYHSSNSCRGLNRCKGAIETISLDEAIKMGRKPCGICGGNPFDCSSGNDEQITKTKTIKSQDYSKTDEKYKGKIIYIENNTGKKFYKKGKKRIYID